MKKNLIIICLTVFILPAILSGCGKSQETESTDIETTQSSIATVAETQAENDWSVELLSKTCDGENAHILFKVTAPTDINLEEANKDYSFTGPDT